MNIGRIRSFGFCCCFVSLLLSGCSFTERVTTGLLLPGGYSEGVALREFLRSSDWKAYRSEVPDSIAMNMIYGLACSLCDGNTEHALLATSVAVLEHRTIPVGLPLHIRFDLPLTLETDRNFDDRVAALPVHVYSDTISDRDKLQHFFFSSYFQRIFGMGWMTRSIGDLVEIGEEAFIVGGEYDNRDRHANADGVRFARRTIGNSPAMPSTSLTPNP